MQNIKYTTDETVDVEFYVKQAQRDCRIALVNVFRRMFNMKPLATSVDLSETLAH